VRAAVRRERLVFEHEQSVADVPVRFEGLPGEYLQVDWGKIRQYSGVFLRGKRPQVAQREVQVWQRIWFLVLLNLIQLSRERPSTDLRTGSPHC
jgi:hypothetical protein